MNFSLVPSAKNPPPVNGFQTFTAKYFQLWHSSVVQFIEFQLSYKSSLFTSSWHTVKPSLWHEEDVSGSQLELLILFILTTITHPGLTHLWHTGWVVICCVSLTLNIRLLLSRPEKKPEEWSSGGSWLHHQHRLLTGQRAPLWYVCRHFASHTCSLSMYTFTNADESGCSVLVLPLNLQQV